MIGHAQLTPFAAAIQEGATGNWDMVTWAAILVAIGLLPFVFTMVTSFAKLVIVGGIMRQALGTPQVPPNSVIAGLAIILTVHIMSPVAFEAYGAYQESAQQADPDSEMVTMERVMLACEVPIGTFLEKHADPVNVRLFESLRAELTADDASDRAAELEADPRFRMLTIYAPAFLLTELTEAFMIGFLLFVPFLVIDLAVGNLLLALGMHMLSPTQISLPLKLLLFVMIDGWTLLLRGLVLGYA